MTKYDLGLTPATTSRCDFLKKKFAYDNACLKFIKTSPRYCP